MPPGAPKCLVMPNTCPIRASNLRLPRSGRLRGGSVKPSAKPTLVQTQHLPPHIVPGQPRQLRSSGECKGNGPRHRRRGSLPGLNEATTITEGLLICSNVIRCGSGWSSSFVLAPRWRPSAELALNSIWLWPSLSELMAEPFRIRRSATTPQGIGAYEEGRGQAETR